MYREIATLGEVDLRVFFACRWGVDSYHDPEFGRAVQWDVPLTEGYEHEFLPSQQPPTKINFCRSTTPASGALWNGSIRVFVCVHGYAQRTLWRAIGWARDRRRPVLSTETPARPARRGTSGSEKRRGHGDLSGFDGAMAVGDRNREYHRRFGMPEERLFPGVLPVERSEFSRPFRSASPRGWKFGADSASLPRLSS